jgi:DNA-binding NtrC family response regulator
MIKNFCTQFLMSPAGFQSKMPTSRLPTKVYDRQSYVMVVSKNEDILKFMKMHLNRYFSHVGVTKSYTEGYNTLKGRDIDLVLVEVNKERMATFDWVRKVGTAHRTVPVIIIDPALQAAPSDFPQSLIVSVIAPPFDLDTLHTAIRRCLNIRASLRDLDALMPPRSNFGQLIQGQAVVESDERTTALINAIRHHLTEEIVD